MNGEDGFDLAGSGAEPLRAQDPRRIGPIPLVGRIGAGGMGRVYLGVTDGRYAAVKQMLASVVAEDEGFVRRFGQEMDNLARLPSEATAPLLASDRSAEPPWFATAYVPGITLAEAVEPHGAPSPSSQPNPGPSSRPRASSGSPFPAGALWLLLREVAAGLKPVHALGMVHRDLKPSNVMLTLGGVTLIDFGIARAAEQSQLTRTGLIVGTPAYMSPEQAMGTRRLTGASDVFALGLLVAYAASGRWPFGAGAEGSPLYRIVHDEPDLASVRERDARLAEVVASCLDKDPEGRPTAAELVELIGLRGPSAPGGWPEAVMEQLTRRAAFAARVPEIEPYVPVAPGTAPDPAKDAGNTGGAGNTAGAGGTGDIPATAPDARSPRRERRRTRILLAVVPVVVTTVGTTLALQNLPYATGPDHAAGSTPSVTVTAPADPTQSSGASASATPASEKPKKPEGKGTSSPDAAVGGADTGGAASGSGAGDTSGGSDGSAGSAGAGSSGTGDGDSSGSSGSGTSDSATGGGEPAPPPSSGTFRLKNADNGSCLIQVYGAADDGNCADPSASWTTVTAENNSIKVVNKQSGACLVANMLGQAVFVGDCTQGTQRLWRWGSGGTLKSVPNGGCLDLAYGGGISTQTCASGKASQSWRKS
ncbi:protein kinase domain-containing protein [Streptomyces sp. NBC_00887]|uniref:serine/threonine-protein kinase n=1 Tax=Streptomyces sp. NBC_00887 TaxID=2975859 RepID=UPI0038685A02|nr:serine/threonine protein kinase [Streptomyces sp. NBC_00887]